MAELKWYQILIEIAVVVIIGVLAHVVFAKLSVLRKVGFFCDDLSIRFPKHPSTVPNWTLPLMSILPILIVVLCEVIRTYKNNARYKFFKFQLPFTCVRVYNEIVAFYFGNMAMSLIVQTSKWAVGKLRPYFLAACEPSINCTSLDYAHVYIIEDVCKKTKGEKERRSFPSGHSALTCYALGYLAIYFHILVKHCPQWRYLVYLVQLLCVTIAWLVSITRVADYKHHWSDVIAGVIIGTLVAFATVTYVSELFKKKEKEKEDDLTVAA